MSICGVKTGETPSSAMKTGRSPLPPASMGRQTTMMTWNEREGRACRHYMLPNITQACHMHMFDRMRRFKKKRSNESVQVARQEKCSPTPERSGSVSG